MFNRFGLHTPHYFQKHLSRQLEELYMSVALQDFALAAVVLFEPIYLFQLGFSIQNILTYYIVVYGLYFFLVPLGGKFVARFGPERSIALSTLMLIGYYASLLLVATHREFFWVAPVFFALQKMWYWPAYHTDFISTSDQGERGKEYSGLWSVTTLMYIIGPAAGGFIITIFGFPALFMMVMAIILLSNIPLFVQPVTWTRQTFSYWNGFTMPFRKIHRRSTIAYLALGEELILLVIWPIFIALAVKNYTAVGGLIAAATFVTAMVTLIIGRLIDQGKRKQVLRWGAILTALTWVIRPGLRTVAAIFGSDTIGRVIKNTTYVGIVATSYERAVREKNVIGRSVFFEQGFAISKLLMAVAVIILANFIAPFSAAFYLAAAVSLLYLLFT